MAETEPNPRPSIITCERLYRALVAADVVREGERIRRIVIDAEVDSHETGHGVVKLYVERFGDERLLDVAPALTGVSVIESTPAEVTP